MRKKISITKKSNESNSNNNSSSNQHNSIYYSSNTDEPTTTSNLAQRLFKQNNSPPRLVAVTSTADYFDHNQHIHHEQAVNDAFVADLIVRNSKKGSKPILYNI
jgi:hypothetical protein